MVSPHGAAPPGPPSGRGYVALARALQWLPALALAMLCLRVGDMAAANVGWDVLPAALLNDLLALLRHGWLAVALAFAALLAWPLTGKWVVGTIWSLVLLLQALLIQYHATTGVPLGADLSAYSWNEIVTTAHGGAVSAIAVLGLSAALLALWSMLVRLSRPQQPSLAPLTLVAAVLVLLVGALLARTQAQGAAGPASYHKGAYFLDDTVRWALADNADAPATASVKTLDPAYPFLRAEQTPDTLGPLLDKASARPNIVLLIVEGLGRSFSGLDARLGSFTPFLDELAGRSLYFENFLAPQGRTFGVLPSLLGSLPFAANGFAAMENMPAHHALPAILRQHGYATRFYIGSNLQFDNEGAYLRQAGVDTLVSQADFPTTLKTSSEWGYADSELVELALRRERAAPRQPYLTIIQTGSTHTPFAFPGKARYLAAVEQRLDALGIPEAKREPYRRQRDIYASLLYLDDALRAWFDGAATLPGHANTIYLVTGDHRLPEIPMETRLERYHVPLIVHSPLLKRPARIKSVSSHFDVAPSLLAYLANQHAMPTPAKVTWLGTGLDLEPSFRNLHALPIKQTRTEPSDFVSGTTYLAQDKLYTITDGMGIEALASAGARAQATSQLQAFAAANNALIRSSSLMPPAALAEVRPYAAAGRSLAATQVAAQSGELFVSDTRTTRAANGDWIVTARFANRANRATPVFVPLLVIGDDKGRELAEAYGKAITVPPAGAALVQLSVSATKLPRATLFASMIPSDPDNGKPVGTGQYHVALGVTP